MLRKGQASCWSLLEPSLTELFKQKENFAKFEHKTSLFPGPKQATESLLFVLFSPAPRPNTETNLPPAAELSQPFIETT